MARPDGWVTDDLAAAIAGAVHDRPCLVALGGGADSAALLSLAAELLTTGKIPSLRGAFVHHHLAGSDELQHAAVALGEALSLPVTVLEAPVADGPDLEARARTARYAALGDHLAPGEVGITAHTLDDQAETVVMRLARGSGTSGLAGIPSRRGPWVRPLLDVPRGSLRAIADARGLPYADDPANADRRFTRTRVRTTVLPAITAELGGSAVRSIARTASLASADDSALERVAADVPIVERDGALLVPASALATLDPAIATRVCRRAIRGVANGLPGSAEDVATVMRVAIEGGAGQITGGIDVVNEGPVVAIGPPQAQPEPVALVDGAFAWGGESYRVTTVGAAPPVAEGGRFTVIAPWAAGEEAVVRGVQPGDTLEIEVGQTPVAELLRVHGVHARRRSISPVIAINGKIAAVVGVRTAVWARPGRGEECRVIEREGDS